MEPHEPEPSPPALWVHFGVVGLAMAWMVEPPLADAYGWQRVAGIARALPAEAVLVAPLLGGVLGAAMATSVGARVARAVRNVLAGSVAASLCGAGFLRVAVADTYAGGLTWCEVPVAGLVIGLALSPAFATVLFAARSRGRARPGTRVDRCDARRPWLATAAVVAGTAAVRLACPHTAPAGACLVLGVACVALAAVLLLDVADGIRLRTPVRRGGPPVVDFGLGQQQATLLRPLESAYREAEEVLCVTRGSAEAARAAIVRIIAGDLVVFAVAVVVAASAAAQI